MMGQNMPQRIARHRAGRLLVLELRRLLHRRTRDQHTARQRGPEQEGYPPPPSVQGRDRHRADRQRGGTDGQQPADLAGGGRRRRDQPAPARRRALDHIRDHAGIFAADRERGDPAQQQQHPSRRRSDLGARREQSRHQHRTGHQRHRQQHRVTAPPPVADIPEDDRAERTQSVGDREPGERGDERRSPAPEEHPRQHRRQVQVQGEIIPFDHRRERRDRHRPR